MEMHKIGPTQLSLRKQIHLCLRPEETVLWEDSPAKGYFFRKANIKLLLLALGFLIVGILWLCAGVHPQYETFPYAMIVLGVRTARFNKGGHSHVYSPALSPTNRPWPPATG